MLALLRGPSRDVRANRDREVGIMAGGGGETVTVTADEAWRAGLEMGRLDAQLAARPVRSPAGLTIRALNARAAEEIANRHGYRLHLRDAEEPGHLWAELRPRG